MNKLLMVLIVVWNIIPDVQAQDELVKINQIISEASSVRYNKWRLILNGDSCYEFETDQNKLIFMWVELPAKGKKHQPKNFKFRSDKDYSRYFYSADEIGVNANKLIKLIKVIDINKIDPDAKRKHLVNLLKCLDEIDKK
jgi:hypothetical protein